MGTQQANECRLIVARELADRFDALVIGAAACNPQPQASFEGLYPVDVVQVDRTYAKERLDAAEAEFRQGFAGRENRIEWRSAFASPVTYLTRLCRAADVAIIGAAAPEILSDPNWRLDPGELVMQAGGPVLVVPEESVGLRAKTVVVGWKDNRESRRAVKDALPSLAGRAGPCGLGRRGGG